MKNLRETFRDMKPDEMREASREAEYASGELKPDGEEVVESGWFDREHLPEIPRHGSIARTMLDAWVAESRKEGSADNENRKVSDL